jgi:site-specific recombinase XerD
MKQEESNPSIAYVIQEYLNVVKLARSQNTALAYGKALKEFRKVLVKAKLDPETTPTSALKEDLVSRFVMHLKSFAPATEQLYVRAVAGFYKYLNFPRMKLSVFSILSPIFPRSQLNLKPNGYAQCETERSC